MLNLLNIDIKQRFSLSNALSQKRHRFRIKNSHLASRKATIRRILESKAFTIGILIPTFYLLFIHDLIGASGVKSSNELSASIGAISIIIFVVFLAEIVCSAIAYHTSYTASGLFFLDIVSHCFDILMLYFFFLIFSGGPCILDPRRCAGGFVFVS